MESITGTARITNKYFSRKGYLKKYTGLNKFKPSKPVTRCARSEVCGQRTAIGHYFFHSIQTIPSIYNQQITRTATRPSKSGNLSYISKKYRIGCSLQTVYLEKLLPQK